MKGLWVRSLRSGDSTWHFLPDKQTRKIPRTLCGRRVTAIRESVDEPYPADNCEECLLKSLGKDLPDES